MLILYFILVSYLLFLVIGIYLWNNYKQSEIESPQTISVSIIIAARNEALHLDSLLKSIQNLTYNKHLLEVIIVDDQSTDSTYTIIQGFAAKSDINIQLLRQTDSSLTPKKAALKLGIEKSKGEILLFTDADCILPKEWVLEMVKPFANHEIELVIGSIKYTDGTFLEHILSIEQAALLGSGYTSLQLGIPTMCNGANMAIRRSTFTSIDGFETKSTAASGDDELLLHKVYHKNRNGVFFLKSARAIVQTISACNLRHLYDQRKRWAGKWEKYLLTRTKAFALFIFIFHVAWLSFATIQIFHPEHLKYFTIFFFLKMSLEFVFIKSVMTFLGKRINLLGFVLLQVIYSSYVVFFGLIARNNHYVWKDRKLN